MLRFKAMQNQKCSGGVLRFAWGDASSKAHRELYNIRYRQLRRDLVVELAAAWRWLSLHPLISSAGYEDNPDITSTRKQHSQLLFRHIRLHTQVPQLLGQSRTGLVDLDDHFASYVSWCTDVGVEARLPEVHVRHAEEILPPYLRPGRGEAVIETGEDLVEEGCLVGNSEEQGHLLMPSALHSPGIMHAVHNSVKAEKVKSVHKFLGHRRRCERFCEAVLHVDDAV